MNQDEELEAIRRKKLEELQKSHETHAQQEYEVTQAKTQIETMMRQVLTTDAWEQWSQARFGNENNAFAAAQAVLQAIQAGQITGKVSKEQLRAILSKVSQMTRREFRIRRR